MISAQMRLAILSVSLGLPISGFANFSITATKTDQGNKDIVELFYRNDGVGGTGTALEAYEATYTGVPIQFVYNPGVDPDPGEVDVYNQPNNLSLSWFRVHPARRTLAHAVPDSSSTLWAAPIGNFTITYATLELIPLPANTSAGVRFARLVLPDGGDFFLHTRVGGEVGPAVNADINFHVDNLAPSITGGGTVISDPAISTGLQTRRVWALDTDGLLTAFTVSDLDHAVAHGFNIAAAGSGAYDISWDPSLVAHGDYRFSLLAHDSSIQSNSSSSSLLTISVVPEPLAAWLLVTGGLARVRRRRA